MQGRPLLALWHNVVPDQQREYELWHTREHLPERLTIPGFLDARRWHRLPHQGNGGEEYCCLLTTRSLDVFQSAEYLRRLNAPSAWTMKMSLCYRDFVRCAVSPVLDWEEGHGAFLFSLRVDVGGLKLASAGDERVERLCERLAELRRETPVVKLTVAATAPEHTAAQTSESRARAKTTESTTDLVVLAECARRDDLTATAAEISGRASEAFPGSTWITACMYELQFELDPVSAWPIYRRNLTTSSYDGNIQRTGITE